MHSSFLWVINKLYQIFCIIARIFFKISHGSVEKYIIDVYNIYNGNYVFFYIITKGTDMKEFFKRYSYESVLLFVNQVAIGIFGLVLVLAAGKAGNTTLRTVCSVFAILFYLFLQFSAMWRVGADDRVSIDLGKKKKDLWVPFKMWLLANSLNILLALLVSFGLWFADIRAFSAIGSVATTTKFILEGMYVGVLAINVGGAPLNTLWFMHFLTVLPSLGAIYASYICGLKNVSFGGLFSYNASSKK